MALTFDELRDLCGTRDLGDGAASREAVNTIVQANVGLVHKVCRRWRDAWDHEDHVQVGFEGLIHAARRFDPDRGTKFSTYAWSAIEQRVRRYRATERQMISGRGYDPGLTDKVVGLVDEGESFDVIAATLGIGVESAEGLWRSAQPGVSFDLLSVRGGADESCGWDWHDEAWAIDDDELEAVEGVDLVDSVMGLFESHFDAYSQRLARHQCQVERDRKIVRLRFEAWTLEEIADEVGLTRQRVKQIVDKAVTDVGRDRITELVGGPV